MLGDPGGLVGLPLAAHLLDLLPVVGFGVVVLAHAAPPLPQRQVLGVHGHAVVVLLASLAEKGPAALLLLQVQPRRVRQEEEGDEHAGQPEPRDEVELGLIADVVVEDWRLMLAKDWVRFCE